MAWQKGMDLAEEIYQLTEKFPAKEIYGLTSQLRRAAVSVPSNIAEGQARFSKIEFRRFCRQARGSLAEIETQLMLPQKLGFVEAHAVEGLLRRTSELGKILNGLIKSLNPAD